MDFKTWLLFNELPNESLENVIREDLEVYSKIDLDYRIPVSLNVLHGKAILKTHQPKLLAETVIKRKNIKAFSLLPSQQLKEIHGRVFIIDNRRIQLLWDGEIDYHDSPYYRRFVTLKHLSTSPQDSLDDIFKTEILASDITDDDALLFIRPEPISFNEEKFKVILLNQGKPIKGINGFFLPPIRLKVDDKSYFSEKRLHLRKEIDSFFKDYPKKNIPLVIVMWKFLNDPMTRDIFLDGASLHIVMDPDDATRLQLKLYVKDDRIQTSFDWLRKVALLEPQLLPMPTLAGVLNKIFIQDLLKIINAPIEICVAPNQLNWFSLTPWPCDRGGSAQGHWDLLSKLKKKLSDKKSRIVLDEFVLHPTRPAYAGNPDHDQAEQLFCSHVFRCPWSDELDAAWRQATLEIVKDIVKGHTPSPEERVASWQESNLDLVDSNQQYIVYYSSQSSDEDLLRWKLLMPLGTIFKTRRTIKLDSFTSRLDRGNVLSQ
jgi:hypothetical protein